MRSTRNQLGLGLVAAGVAAAGAFAFAAESVRRDRSRDMDDRVRRRFPRARQRRPVTERVVHALGYSGKWWAHGPIAVMAAGRLWRTGHRRAASALVMASATGAIATRLFDATIFRAPAPPGHPDRKGRKSFPSGHTLELAALSLTAGWVALREELAPAGAVIPLALTVPLASGVGRMYLDRHWTSDVIGGYLAGAAIAAWCAAAYEAVPEKRLRRLEKRAARAADRVGDRAGDLASRAWSGGASATRKSARGAHRGFVDMGSGVVRGIALTEPMDDEEADRYSSR